MSGQRSTVRARIVTVALAATLLTVMAAAQNDSADLGLEQPALLGEPLGPPLAGDELVAKADEVTRLMRCPVCQGLSVADSPTDSAQAMKREATDLLAFGYTEDQVLSYFERSYGEFIRLEPKAEGFNILVWIVPVAGLLLGVALIAMRLRGRAQRPGSARESSSDPALEAYRDRVRREVGR